MGRAEDWPDWPRYKTHYDQPIPDRYAYVGDKSVVLWVYPSGDAWDLVLRIGGYPLETVESCSGEDAESAADGLWARVLELATLGVL